MKKKKEIMQPTGITGFQTDKRVEPGCLLEVQTYMRITENTFTGFNCPENGLLEYILSPVNLNRAYKQVKSNKGKGGIDGLEVDDLLDYLLVHKEALIASIYDGKYRPTPVRGIEIPKSGGKKRKLGIPGVVDRLIQQAIAQVISPLFEPRFSDTSYGFRPGRSAHQALKKCCEYIEEGHLYTVDMDLEQFFDTVNHSKLIEVLSGVIKDGRVVSLIHRYLNAGVVILGQKYDTPEGVPQGGPLSPLLGNILLNELDKELERRGHKYVRYADDLLIFCKSRRAADRRLANILPFIEKKLFLKVNREKTKTAHYRDIGFLSYAFGRRNGKAQLYVHKGSVARMKDKLREITCRSNGWGYEFRKLCLSQFIEGWINYFKLAGLRGVIAATDKWLRRRIRMCIWKSWKRVKTRYRNLMKLIPDENRVRTAAFCRKGHWRMSMHPAVMEAMTEERLRKAGYPTLSGYYRTLKL